MHNMEVGEDTIRLCEYTLLVNIWIIYIQIYAMLIINSVNKLLSMSHNVKKLAVLSNISSTTRPQAVSSPGAIWPYQLLCSDERKPGGE